MDVYCEKRVEDALHKEYEYIFADFKYPGVPNVNVNIIENKEFYIDEVKVTPIRVMHQKLPVFAFRIGDITYVTDANYLMKSLKKLEVQRF